MKNLQTFDEFLNESKKFKGKKIFPDWVDSTDISGGIRNVKDLTQGANYVILDPGMDVWQAEWEYQGVKGGIHTFVSTVQFNTTEPLEFTDKELEDSIKNAEIFLMK